VMRGEIVEAELGRLIVRRSVKEPRHTISEGGTVGSIDSRLRRLEERGDSCPECGLSAAARRPIAVVYPDDSDKGFEGDPYTSCTWCGHALYAVLRVVYDADRGEGTS
jgi:hypothetical protein